MTATIEVPAWWRTDREHAPAVYAAEFINKSLPRSDDAPIDFESWWKQPMSSGERILVALAWTLYNLSWARDQEQREAKRKTYTGGPLFWSNPCNAIARLSPDHWSAYVHMLALGRGAGAR